MRSQLLVAASIIASVLHGSAGSMRLAGMIGACHQCLHARHPGLWRGLPDRLGWLFRAWSKEDDESILLHGSSQHGISKQAYLLQWVYKAARHPPAALEHILLLGFRGEVSALFSMSAPRRQERKPEVARRSVFQVRCTV